MALCYHWSVSRSQQDKKRTTIYMSSDVLEFLKIRSAKGRGSVSQQLETLARELMPATSTREDIEQLERKHAQGYEAHPVADEEFADFYSEQDLGSP